MTDELKPCPFCGGFIYSEFHSNNKEEFDGHCTNINCALAGEVFLFMNVDKWNARPIEDALRAENERLTAELTAERTAERERNRWIPVSQDAPKQVRVLIKMQNNYVVIATFYGDKWKNDNGSEIETSNVVCWRPIVAPEVE